MQLSELQKLIANYMVGTIQTQQPQIQTQTGSTFNDLFVVPMVTILTPFLEQFNRMDLNQDLSNASLIDPADLDKIGESNYFVSRSRGQRASTTVTVYMDPSFAAMDVLIPPITAAAGSLQYSSSTPVFIKASDSSIPDPYATVLPGVLSNYLNPSTAKYEFPIEVVAQYPGTEYNVVAGKIDTLVTKYPMLNDTVTNLNAVTNGTEDEDNVSYVNRIRRVYLTRNLGTNVGYTEYIRGNFEAADDLRVVGYGSSDMRRDVIVDPNGNITSTHIGGKVDVYIKGFITDTFTQYASINSARFQLTQPTLDSAVSLAVVNKTNSMRIPAYHIEYQYPGSGSTPGSGNVYLVIDNSASLTSGDLLEVQYNAFINSTDLQSQAVVDTFYFGSNKIRLLYNPNVSVASVMNTTKGTTLPASAYTLTELTDEKSTWVSGSIYSAVDLTITDASKYNAGDSISIVGSYNALIGQIQEELDGLGTRIITTDILIKQCPITFVNVGLNIACIKPKHIGAFERTAIFNVLSTIIEGSPIGGTIQASDLINALYTNSTTSTFVDYIQTPIVMYDSASIPNESDSIFMNELSLVTTGTGGQTSITTPASSTAAGTPSSNTTALSAPTVPPVLNAVTQTTSLTAGTYTVSYSFANATGQTTTGPTTNVTITSGQAITVGAIVLPTGATRVNYFISTAVNSLTQAYLTYGTGGQITITSLPGQGAASVPIGDTSMITNPSTAPVISATTPGTQTPLVGGQYLIAYTFTNALGETLISPTASMSINAGQAIQISAITLPAGATGIRYYIASPDYSRKKSIVTLDSIQIGRIGKTVIKEITV